MWSLYPPPSRQNCESLQTDIVSMATDLTKSNTVSSTVENGSKSLKYQMKARSNWPPAEWKTAPGYGPHAAGNTRIKTLSIEKDADMILTEGEVPIVSDGDWTIRDDPGCETANDYLSLAYNQTGGMDGTVDPAHSEMMPDQAQRRSLGFGRIAITGGSNDQAMATGRSGERIAFRYLTGKYGEEGGRWVNEAQETVLPYDMLVVKEHEHDEQQYIEVKATQSERKDFFFISARE